MMIQMTEPLETAELLAFTRTIEAKTLSRAAAELGVPRATIGRRLSKLEERLGTRLIRRTTRALALTEAGETFYRHARNVLAAIASAEASVRVDGGVMRGDLRVSAFPNVHESFFDVVTSFAREHPGVRVQVDFSTRVVDLLREGYDVALRASEIHPGLVARTIARRRMIAVASPEYLAQHGTPTTVKHLRQHRCLTSFSRGELPQSEWPVGRGVAHVEGTLSSNDPRLLCEAALRHLGIALLPTLVVDEHLESGALVRVLPGLVDGEVHIAVVYAERELLPARVRAFVECVVAWAGALEESPCATLLSAAQPSAAPSHRAARGARRALGPRR